MSGRRILGLNDNGHGKRGGTGYVSGLREGLDRLDEPSVHAEDVATDAATRERHDRLLDGFADGSVSLLSPEYLTANLDREYDSFWLSDDDEAQPVGGPDDTLVTLLRETDDHPDEVGGIDGGPVHDQLTDEVITTAKAVDRLGTGHEDVSDVEEELVAKMLVVRDANWTEFLLEETGEGDEALFSVGSSHRVQEKVGRYPGAERLNEFTVDTTHGPDQRAAVVDALGNADVGDALFGDPEELADAGGVGAVQPRLAAVGARLRDEDRFVASAGDWLDGYNDAVYDAARPAEDGESEASRIARLQTVARDRLSELTSLDDPGERSEFDLATDGVEFDTSDPAALVTGMLPGEADDRVRDAVDALVEGDVVHPERLAAAGEAFGESPAAERSGVDLPGEDPENPYRPDAAEMRELERAASARVEAREEDREQTFSGRLAVDPDESVTDPGERATLDPAGREALDVLATAGEDRLVSGLETLDGADTGLQPRNAASPTPAGERLFDPDHTVVREGDPPLNAAPEGDVPENRLEEDTEGEGTDVLDVG